MLKYFYGCFAITFFWAALCWEKTPVPDINGQIFEEEGILRCGYSTKSSAMHVMKGLYYTTDFVAPYGITGGCGSGNREVGKKVAVKWVSVPSRKVRYIISIRDLTTNQLYKTEPEQRAKIAAFAEEFKTFKLIFLVFFMIFLCAAVKEWRKK
jgi:hypothetical protein